MAEGKDTFKGLGVPLNGNFEITGQVAALDIMTITGAASQTGEYVICQTQNGTEELSLKKGGRIGFGSIPTTDPTTGLIIGDVWAQLTSSYMQIAIAQSNQEVRLINTTSA